MLTTLRRVAVLSLALGLLAGCSLIPTRAIAAKPGAVSVAPLHVEAPQSQVQDVANVQRMLAELLDASNQHDLKGVLKHYSPHFTSGDSLSLKDIRNLIQDTWGMFPDIRYESQVLEIRLNGNWATVESIDTATASAKVDPAISDTPGQMRSRSRGLLYLHRVGKTWEILSDFTLYERATISYGPYVNVSIDVESPEQVFAGESYTAKVSVGVPPGNIAFATLTQEPLTYPQAVSKDKFRTLSMDKTDLERIFKANTSNNNEVITATVGFTEIGQDDQERPTINLRGITTVVKRVNVIPRSTFSAENNLKKLVTTTADGKIQVDSRSPDADGEDESLDEAGPDELDPKND